MKRLKFSRCKYCGETKPRSEMATRKDGTLKGKRCKDCSIKNFVNEYKDGGRIIRLYRSSLKSSCEICGFTGEKKQLDIHHLDGNHKNNTPKNLQTVCANCHRLL